MRTEGRSFKVIIDTYLKVIVIYSNIKFSRLSCTLAFLPLFLILNQHMQQEKYHEIFILVIHGSQTIKDLSSIVNLS